MFGRTPIRLSEPVSSAVADRRARDLQESAITGEGRLHAGDFRAIVDEAARQRRLEPLDRVNGGLTDWPGGAGVYAYGVGFHQYLADRFGAGDAGQRSPRPRRGASRIPRRAAFKRVYGESLGDLWREYQASLTANVARGRATDPCADATDPSRILCQRSAIRSASPAPAVPPRSSTRPRNPDGFPGAVPRRRRRRRAAAADDAISRFDDRRSAATQIYFDQVEIRRNIGLYSDLYALSRADGRVRRLTSDARLLDPDLSPDGETLVVRAGSTADQRDLVSGATACSREPQAAHLLHVGSGLAGP